MKWIRILRIDPSDPFPRAKMEPPGAQNGRGIGRLLHPIQVVPRRTFRVERNGERIRVAVIDHGVGLDADQCERIFGRFERAAPAQHYPGLGLGLYVAREIVEAHGGRIRAEGVPGSGATFTLELPA